MRNRNILFSLRLLKSILDTFIDTFLVFYVLNVSEANIIPLGAYHLIMVLTIYFTIYALKNRARTKHRVALMRIAMIIDIVYFLAIIIFKQQLVRYVYILGLLRGLEEGFYYSVYNTIESDNVDDKQRAKYTGSYLASKSILAAVFPIILGGVISTTGFVKSTTIVLVVVLARLLTSCFFRDRNLPRTKKVNLSKFQNLISKDRRFKRLAFCSFFNGLTSSTSAFSNIITIFIIKVFSDSFSLGIFTAIFSIVAGFSGIFFAKFLKKKHYSSTIGLTMLLTIITLVWMIFDCNPTSIILFKLCRTISLHLISSINETTEAYLCNREQIRHNYKMEYWLNIEKWLMRGRAVSDILFLLMAVMSSWTPIMLIFTAALGIFGIASIQLQKSVRRMRHTNRGAVESAYAYRTVTKK